MKTKKAEVLFWNNQAYIPSMIQYRSGISSITDPLFVVKPLLCELVPVVTRILAIDPPVLPDPSLEEIRKQNKFLPTKTGAGSLQRLYKESFFYLIELSDKGFLLCIPETDLKHGWVFKDNNIFYPLNTELQVIIQEMLDDYNKRKPPK